MPEDQEENKSSTCSGDGTYEWDEEGEFPIRIDIFDAALILIKILYNLAFHNGLIRRQEGLKIMILKKTSFPPNRESLIENLIENVKLLKQSGDFSQVA